LAPLCLEAVKICFLRLQTNVSSRAIGFRQISHCMGSVSIFLRWLKNCTCLYSSNFTPQVKKSKESIVTLGNRFHVTPRIVSPYICRQC